MYGNRRSSQPLKSLTDMPLVQRSDLARQRERSLHSGIGSDLGFMQDPILQRKGMSLPDRSLGSSILGDPPLMSTPKGFSASGLGRVSSALPGARETSMSAFRQDAPMARNTRQREGLGRSLGEDTLQRAGLGRSLQQDNMERERLERERQRQVDLQRRAELQRDLELERAKMRRQKQEEERERELQEDMRRRREEERLRDLEREREEERIREREREIERQEEKERERRRIQMERERTEREILQKKALIQQRKEKLQHEIAQNRERKLQQDYEENEKRRALERQRRNEVEAKRHQEMEMQEARKIQMLREREAAIEQQLAFNREQQMAISAPPQQMMMMQQQQQMQMMATAQQQRPAIPSLVNMPIPMGPAPTFKSNNDDASFMEKVRLQQALLAQQNQGQGPSVNQNQNRKNRGRNNRQGAGNQKRGQQNKPGDRKQPGNRNQASNRKGKSRWGQPSPQQGKKPASAAGNKKTGSAAGSKQPESLVQKNGADTMPPQKDGASNSKDKPNDEVLYDPLHPTEDEETETGARKRRRSEGELQVRIEQGKTSRDVLDPPGAKQAKLSVESSQASMTNAGQQADKMLKMMQLPHSMEWKCHACNIKCNEVMNYHRHMMGRRHQNMMAHIMEVAQTNTTEALESLKVDKYLARVYKGYKSRGESTERQSAHFCSACLTYVFGPMQGHKASAAHKNALASKNQKCKICNKNFKTLTAFLNHCNTMAHKMMFEVHSMKELKVEASRKAAEKTFVTLDEVGFEGEIENKESSTAKGAKGPASKLTADQKRVDSVFQKLLRKPRAAQASQAVDPTATPKSDPSLAQGPANSGLTPEIVGQIKNLPWTAEDLVSFNPDKILGQEYVIPVTGYFCKLCRKFYNSENSARVIHCKSQSHFKNLQKMNDEMKLAAELVKKDEKPEPTEGAKPAEETKPEAVTEEKETKSVESDNKNETTEEITKEEQEESEVKEEIKEEKREVTKKTSGELKVKLDKIEIPAEEGDEKGEDTMEDEKPQEEEENVVKEDEEGMDQETEDDGAGSTEAEDTIEEGSQEDIFVDQGDQEGGEDLLGGGEEDAGDDDGEAVEQDEILETTGEEEMAMDA